MAIDLTDTADQVSPSSSLPFSSFPAFPVPTLMTLYLLGIRKLCNFMNAVHYHSELTRHSCEAALCSKGSLTGKNPLGSRGVWGPE